MRTSTDGGGQNGKSPVIACILVLSTILTLGFLTAASADVVNIDNFAVTLNGVPLFSDSFGAGLTLAGGGGTGTVLPSGMDFSNSTTQALYQVIGTLTEIGNKGLLDSALGPSWSSHRRSPLSR